MASERPLPSNTRVAWDLSNNMAFHAANNSNCEDVMRIPTGDWRYCSFGDAHHKYQVHREETEQAYAYQPQVSKNDDLERAALAAILAHQDVGTVHRCQPKPDPEPKKQGYNHLHPFSVTASSFAHPPAVPKPLSKRDDEGLTPRSKLHNRRLGTETGRVRSNHFSNTYII